MPGGKTVWCEYDSVSPQQINVPAKGGQRSATSVVVSGKKALLVGKPFKRKNSN